MKKNYPFICSICRMEAEVPFQPKEGQKLTCKLCFKKNIEEKKDQERKLKIKDPDKARIVNHSLDELSQFFNFRKK